MMKEMDNFSEVTFTGMDEFIDFLAAREENTKRFTVSANQLKFITIATSKKWYKSEDEIAARLGVDVELVEDTAVNTDIIVTIGGNKEPYLLGSSSWISVKNRIEIYGRGFDLLDTDDKVRDINKRMTQLGDKQVQVIVADKKIRAIMSDEYAVVPTADLFKSIVDHISTRFETYEMVSGYIDHNISRCKLLLPEMKDEINGLYSLPDEYIPGVIIETSDTGYSANKIGTYWKIKSGSFINQNEYIYMQHKGDTNLDKILDELPNLFLKYQNTLKKFAKLMTVEVKEPIKTLKKACKHIGISRKLTKQLVEQFEVNLNGSGSVTAYDLCREIFTLPSMVDNSQKTVIEEKVGKAINLNYETLADDDEDDN